MGAACFLVLPVLLLGSCMLRVQTAPAQDAPTPAQARDALYSTLDDTQEIVGGDWLNQDDPTSRGCMLGAAPGRTYSALRTAPPAADAAAAVAASWTDAGYSVTTTQVGPVAQVIGMGDGIGSARAVLIFRSSDRAVTLQGESECRPATTG